MPGAVLFVDDDEDLREMMRDAFDELGVATTVTACSLDEVQARRAEALGCRLAIIDVNLGADQPSGINVCEWLQSEGFGGRVVFLTGHAGSDPTVRSAACAKSAQVASKPLSIAELGRLVEAAVPAE